MTERNRLHDIYQWEVPWWAEWQRRWYLGLPQGMSDADNLPNLMEIYANSVLYCTVEALGHVVSAWPLDRQETQVSHAGGQSCPWDKVPKKSLDTTGWWMFPVGNTPLVLAHILARTHKHSWDLHNWFLLTPPYSPFPSADCNRYPWTVAMNTIALPSSVSPSAESLNLRVTLSSFQIHKCF